MMKYEEYEALGVIDDERMTLNDLEGFRTAMGKFPRGQVVVSVKVLREKRSNGQNRFWHGVVIPAFAEHCGYEFDEMKDALALELMPHEVTDMKTGEVRTVPGHTSKLNTKQFKELIERAQRLGAEMGVHIPDPGEMGYSDEAQTPKPVGKVTHCTPDGATPDRYGNIRTSCGDKVNERKGETDEHTPTCPKCASILKARDEEPLPAWAKV